MEKQTKMGRIRQEGASFLEAIGKSNELFYLVLLTMYVTLFLVLKVSWTSGIAPIVSNVRYGMLSVVMWGASVYLFFVIVSWKKLWKNTPALIIIGATILSVTFFFSAKMSTNAYGVVMDIFFCLMACGKDYKKILKCITLATVGMLVIAAIGCFTGFTNDLQKPGEGMVYVGHSFGIEYPNNWGYVVFLAMMTGWYVYLKNRYILTFVLFLSVSIFMIKVVECRTIALLTIVFPVCALGVNWLEKRNKNNKKDNGVMGWIVTIMPIIMFAFVLISSLNYLWVDANIPDTFLLGSLRYRFIHNGLYLKSFGFPIFGNPYRSNIHNYVNVNGQFVEPGILDCSYISYAIMRGAVWMGYTLLWLCIANHKAVKNRDYAINYLSAILLVFAMIERPGLEMWYNFVLLYPLAATGYLKADEHTPPMVLTGNPMIQKDINDGNTEGDASPSIAEENADGKDVQSGIENENQESLPVTPDDNSQKDEAL